MSFKCINLHMLRPTDIHIRYTTLQIAAECYLLLAFISQHAALFMFMASSDAAPVVSCTELCGNTDCVSCSFLPVITKSNVMLRCAASDGESQGGTSDYPQRRPSTPAASDRCNRNFICCCLERLFRTNTAKEG